MGIQQALQNVLTNPTYLAAWGALVAVSLAVLVWGLRKNNSELKSLMKFVWGSRCCTPARSDSSATGTRVGPKSTTTRSGGIKRVGAGRSESTPVETALPTGTTTVPAKRVVEAGRPTLKERAVSPASE